MRAMDPVGVLVRANDEFARRLALVGPDDWGRPTPCSEWDVRALVDHVVGANLRYVLLLHEEPLAAVEAIRAVDQLGDDPRGRFATTAREVVAAFREPGALDRTVPHRTGDKTGRELLAMKVLDVAVHAWDLARSIATDDALDDGVVELALTQGLPVVLRIGSGVFATPEGALPPDASPQERLLHQLGRHPERTEIR
jgi:uncharacterized protein (TIGR03086 family)